MKKKVSKDSPFDTLLLKGFDIALKAQNPFEADPRKFTWGLVTGTLGLVKQLHGKGTQTDDVDVADTSNGNFTKHRVNDFVGNGTPDWPPVDVFVNTAPLSLDHFLLVPHSGRSSPQHLTEELLLEGLKILEMSQRLDFRLLYDSEGIIKDVDNFHYHGMYLNQISVLFESRFPIERAGRTNISGTTTEGSVSINMLIESEWYVRGFELEAGCKLGTGGLEPPGDINALAETAMRIVMALEKKKIPHRLLLCPPPTQKRAKKKAMEVINEEVLSDEFIPKPEAVSPEIYILPQKPSSVHESASHRFDEVISSTIGLLTMPTEQDFENSTEEEIKKFFNENVSLPGAEFDKLICSVAWLVLGSLEG